MKIVDVFKRTLKYMFIGEDIIPDEVIDADDVDDIIDEVIEVTNDFKYKFFLMICRFIMAAAVFLFCFFLFCFFTHQEFPCFLENMLASSFTSLLSISVSVATIRE
jgi:hypothetical protein